jgi:hypothetical protein
MDPAGRRVSVSTRLAPGSKELAQAIAEVLDLPGWGHAVDLALFRMAEVLEGPGYRRSVDISQARMVKGGQELKAKKGIVVKGVNDGKV